MPKPANEFTAVPSCGKSTLGESPAVLAKRDFIKPNFWCPKPDIEYDPWCDQDNPKTITYKDIVHATSAIKKADISKTPLVRSRCCGQFEMELNYKFETFHRTGSFHERGALYSLLMLSEGQRVAGVITASTGNWAMALAYQGKRLGVPVTVVLPSTSISFADKCEDFEATTIIRGCNLAEAKRQAFVMISEGLNCTYINGYDHPHVIAGSGCIGIEILEQLPETEAILIPVGGGGLIAGIAAVVKQLKPEILIYGIESDKNCCFFKAMENERPYQTMVGRSIAGSLAVPTAGYNAFHTARSLIDKMVLVDDDWLTRAISHLIEEEKLVVDGAGAASLSALLAIPNVLPELRGKSVVCVISGGNIDQTVLPWCLERAKAVEGRLIKVTVCLFKINSNCFECIPYLLQNKVTSLQEAFNKVKLPADDTKEMVKVLSIISNVGCNLRMSYKENAWLLENDFDTIYVTYICETRDLEHACTLKRVMEKLLPGMCDFLEEPYSPIPMCACFPKRLP